LKELVHSSKEVDASRKGEDVGSTVRQGVCRVNKSNNGCESEKLRNLA